jgi:hypothetical protein
MRAISIRWPSSTCCGATLRIVRSTGTTSIPSHGRACFRPNRLVCQHSRGLGPSCNRAGVTGGGQRECDRRFANRSLKAQTSPIRHEGWSLYGAQGSQPVATAGKCRDGNSGSNTRKPLPSVATGCMVVYMVRRGRRFESVRGLAEEPCKWACCVAHDGEILNPRGYGYTLGLAALAYTRDVSWHSLERLGTLDRDRSHATTVSVCCCSTRSPCQSRSPHSL